MAKKHFLLIDGYNIIFSWNNLSKTAQISLVDARKELIDLLCDYRGMISEDIILVFDAHKVKNNGGSVETFNNIRVVYTKEAETADSYIEKATHSMIKNSVVRVATSDNMEQIIILTQGAQKISAIKLQEEIYQAKKFIREKYVENRPIKNNLLMDNLDCETMRLLEQMRRSHFNLDKGD